MKLKYYNGDIYLKGIIDEFELPSNAKYQFEKQQFFDSNTKDIFIIDGIEHIRKDSI